MYGYRVYLYSVENPIRTANETHKIKLLYPWNNRYLELIGFVKNKKPVSIHNLEELGDLNILRGYSPVFISILGNPVTLKYRVKSIEKVLL